MDSEIPTLDYADAAALAPAIRRQTIREWILRATLMIALQSLLALMAYPALQPQGCPASRQTLAQAELGPNGSMSQAIDLFKFQLGHYPRSLDELMQIADDAPGRARWKGPYLKDEQSLLDPWGHPYQYNPTPKHNVGSYDLWSLGPNGIDESSDDDGDDIVNWRR